MPVREFSRIGRWLFEPSRSIVGVVERRRARMLPKLQLAHAAQMLLSINIVRHIETGRTRELMPKTLAIMGLCFLVCYALSRTRHIRVSIFGYVVCALAYSPIALAISAPIDGFLPLMSTIFLLPHFRRPRAATTSSAAVKWPT